ncbi:restriction endonuclease subunit S [Acinetobacter baumannii]|uniref:restriction endonuclease subunit S n=1 Tax=Acinetobacter baumannii TaxID=470 RepID=UPI000DA9AA91|nr:restriction endonuclease subunit S [Acinetobacter baumannii]EKV5599478.1 restriction endonuclease subunit S [Acinetobacter baumannii]EKV5698886.1 restriction endonuclease subunit S [Acinetobacter baumannii]EKV6803605.1 restriction endonuclease subunit S [Acinetobacter baumannii]EKV6848284.1 restriction endonuclease subunit S [Acinetobacter baumannii]EKV6915780.1 restriction endonuclease subunit S [Acinetobacter baumannii]
MAKYQAYAEYKDSGVEWLGEIPSHWDLRKFKHHFRSAMGETILGADLIEDGKLPVYSATEGDHFFGYVNSSSVVLEKGDFVIPARGNSIGFPKLVVTTSTCSQTTIYAKMHKKIHSKFTFYYLLGCKPYLFQFVQTAIPQITVEEVKNNHLVHPSLEEQIKIANFLDYETAKIDHLIEKQQQLIELLKEKRQAVISHAVTKGLNPNVPMKDSGVEWLGEVPQNWTATKIGFHALKIGSGKTPKGGAEIYQDEGVLFIRSQNVYNDGLRVDNSESVYISEAIHDEMSTSKIYSGDILLNITGGSIGRSSLVPDKFPEANVNQHVCIIRVRKYLQEFLALVIQSDLIQAQLRSIQTGGNREGLNFEQISKFWFVLPPKDEQEQIILFIKNKLNEFGKLEARANKAIQLMQERRTALISAAVTGKIDVRHWQSPTVAEADTELSA